MTTGGTEVTVHGTNFLSLDMSVERPAIEVRIGNLICPKVVVISDNVLRVTTPVRLCSEKEVHQDREFESWKAWFLAPRPKPSEKGKINFKRRPKLQKRIKWVPPGVLEVRVVRANGERQYSSLQNASSFEAAACHQPLFEWVVEDGGESSDEMGKSEKSDLSCFESSDDDDAHFHVDNDRSFSASTASESDDDDSTAAALTAKSLPSNFSICM